MSSSIGERRTREVLHRCVPMQFEDGRRVFTFVTNLRWICASSQWIYRLGLISERAEILHQPCEMMANVLQRLTAQVWKRNRCDRIVRRSPSPSSSLKFLSAFI